MQQSNREKLNQKVSSYKEKIRCQLKKKINNIKVQQAKFKDNINDQSIDNSNQQSPQFGADFSDLYELKEKIGEGAHALVYKAVKKIDQEEYAVKVFRTSDPEIIATIKKTHQITSILSHQNIIKVKELYINKQIGYSYQVMELCQYPSLESQIHKLTIDEIKIVLKGVFIALIHMQEKKVCHRDLKPDNILFDGKNIKIIDFGVSKRYFIKNQYVDMWTPTGTSFYCAPEIYTQASYSYKIDLWATGVIMYQLLTKTLPFQDETAHGTIELICKAQPKDHPSLDKISKDLLLRLLNADPKKRLSAVQAASHIWFENQDSKQRIMDDLTVHDGLANNSSLIIQMSQSQNRTVYESPEEKMKMEAFRQTIHVRPSQFQSQI